MHLDLLLVRAEGKHDSIMYYKVTGIIILLFLGVLEKTGPESPSFGFLRKKKSAVSSSAILVERYWENAYFVFTVGKNNVCFGLFFGL